MMGIEVAETRENQTFLNQAINKEKIFDLHRIA